VGDTSLHGIGLGGFRLLAKRCSLCVKESLKAPYSYDQRWFQTVGICIAIAFSITMVTRGFDSRERIVGPPALDMMVSHLSVWGAQGAALKGSTVFRNGRISPSASQSHAVTRSLDSRGSIVGRPALAKVVFYMST
jgi:hypothetical protein